MTGRIKDLNRALKGHDSYLYAQSTHPPRVDVCRRARFSLAPPNYIFSLTDTWTASGVPVPWGIEVVLNRLKAADLWRDDSFVENWIKENDKVEASKERDHHNSVESFLYDFAPQFQKATNDINTGTMNKVYRKEGR